MVGIQPCRGSDPALSLLSPSLKDHRDRMVGRPKHPWQRPKNAHESPEKIRLAELNADKTIPVSPAKNHSPVRLSRSYLAEIGPVVMAETHTIRSASPPPVALATHKEHARRLFAGPRKKAPKSSREHETRRLELLRERVIWSQPQPGSTSKLKAHPLAQFPAPPGSRGVATAPNREKWDNRWFLPLSREEVRSTKLVDQSFLSSGLSRGTVSSAGTLGPKTLSTPAHRPTTTADGIAPMPPPSASAGRSVRYRPSTGSMSEISCHPPASRGRAESPRQLWTPRKSQGSWVVHGWADDVEPSEPVLPPVRSARRQRSSRRPKKADPSPTAPDQPAPPQTAPAPVEAAPIPPSAAPPASLQPAPPVPSSPHSNKAATPDGGGSVPPGSANSLIPPSSANALVGMGLDDEAGDMDVEDDSSSGEGAGEEETDQARANALSVPRPVTRALTLAGEHVVFEKGELRITHLGIESLPAGMTLTELNEQLSLTVLQVLDPDADGVAYHAAFSTKTGDRYTVRYHDLLSDSRRKFHAEVPEGCRGQLVKTTINVGRETYARNFSQHRPSKSSNAIFVVPGIMLLLKLQESEHVLNLKSALLDASRLRIMTVLEPMNMSLARLLSLRGPMPEPILASVMLHVLSAIEYIHDKLRLIINTVDINNLFVCATGCIKLGNMGLCCPNVPDAEEFRGRLRFMPPERLLRLSCVSASDIWSVGCLAYELATGVPTFDPATFPTLLGFKARVAECVIPEPPASAPPLSPNLLDFCQACMQKQAVQRPAARELKHFKAIKPHAAVPQKALVQWMHGKSNYASPARPAAAEALVEA